MKTAIKVSSLKTLLEQFTPVAFAAAVNFERRATSLEPSESVDVEIVASDLTFLGALEQHLNNLGEVKARRAVQRLLKGATDIHGVVKRSLLPHLPTLLTNYIQAHVKENPGCIYLVSTRTKMHKGVAYLPLSAEYHPPEKRGYRTEGRVVVSLAYNVNGSYEENDLVISPRHLDRTISQILLAHGYMMMSLAELEAYKATTARYEAYFKFDKEQMLARGTANVVGSRRGWWETDQEVELSPGGQLTKVVLNLSRISSRTKSAAYSALLDENSIVPTHPVHPVFSLVHHQYVWVNVADMKPYRYESVRDKLVLPESHSRLIGALVSNLDILQGDAAGQSALLSAKAASNVILAMGPPGTGKTLTAEVYAEEIRRPLYEVASGQLGVNAEDVEQNLKEILRRSIDLNMPLLINEADVFIRTRGNDIEQNAICAVFLRLIEYHSGLVFLTTNIECIDDAFLSRCLAEIRYTPPGKKERREIWKVQLKQFGAELSAEELEQAVQVFPEVVGRDVQNLLRLTLRYCKAISVPFSLSMLKECAVFKRIKVA